MNPTVELVGDPIVRLEMDVKTAEALHAVIRVVGGHPNTTRRGLIRDIGRALVAANVHYNANDVEGGIYFRVTHYVQN